MIVRRTKISWPLTLLTIVLIALMCSLGLWQLDRADQSRQRLAAYAAGVPAHNVSLQTMPERFSQVVLEGRFDSSRQIVMDGFSVDKRAGYQVLTPFRVKNSDTVLMVNRGWRVWTGNRLAIEGLEVGDEWRTVHGRAERFWEPGMVLGDGNSGEASRWPRIVVYPQHAEISDWMQQSVATWQLLLDPEEADGFFRHWSPGGLAPERHIGYAVQWFLLAVTLLVLYSILTFRRSKSSEETK